MWPEDGLGGHKTNDQQVVGIVQKGYELVISYVNDDSREKGRRGRKLKFSKVVMRSYSIV